MEMKNPNWKLNHSNADSWLVALLPHVYLQNYFAPQSPATHQSKSPPTSSTTDQTLNFTAQRIYMLKGCNLTGTSWGWWLNLGSGLPPLSCWGPVISPAVERVKLPPTNT